LDSGRDKRKGGNQPVADSQLASTTTDAERWLFAWTEESREESVERMIAGIRTPKDVGRCKIEAARFARRRQLVTSGRDKREGGNHEETQIFQIVPVA